MCDYEIEYYNLRQKKPLKYKCYHDNYNNDNYCIFHSEISNKNIEDFNSQFRNIIDKGKSEFIGFIFPKNANFQKLPFGQIREANFAYATFYCKTNFSNIKFNFSRGISFRKAKFLGDGDVTFNSSYFSGGGSIDFSYVKFNNRGLVDFSNSTFDDGVEVYFEGRTFYQNTIVSMMNMNIKNTKKFVFNDVDLSRCLFLDTYIRDFDFRDVYWTNREYNPVNIKKESYLSKIEDIIKFDFKSLKKRAREIERRSRWMLFDEALHSWEPDEILEDLFSDKKEKNDKEFFKEKLLYLKKEADPKNEKEKILYKIYRLYAQLQIKYEETLRRHEAGDFFAGQMEMRRLGNFENKFYIRALLRLYKCISLYGESPFRAFGWFLATPLFFTIFYLFGGLKCKNGFEKINYDLALNIPFFTCSFWKDFFNTLSYSISNAVLGRTFTTLIPEDGWSIFLSILENIFGVIFLSMFILAMNRKFRRKKD